MRRADDCVQFMTPLFFQLHPQQSFERIEKYLKQPALSRIQCNFSFCRRLSRFQVLVLGACRGSKCSGEKAGRPSPRAIKVGTLRGAPLWSLFIVFALGTCTHSRRFTAQEKVVGRSCMKIVFAIVRKFICAIKTCITFEPFVGLFKIFSKRCVSCYD